MTARRARSHATAAYPAWTTQLVVGGHHFVADEPQEVGGTDTGPTPEELVLSALAACTSITVRMYAARKQWPLQGIDVEVEFTARDREHTAIRRTLSLAGPLDEAQRDRLRQVAEACPVHRLLVGQVDIDTALAA